MPGQLGVKIAQGQNKGLFFIDIYYSQASQLVVSDKYLPMPKSKQNRPVLSNTSVCLLAILLFELAFFIVILYIRHVSELQQLLSQQHQDWTLIEQLKRSLFSSPKH